MATYRELLQSVKSEISEISTADTNTIVESGDAPILIDVREQDEWQEGHLPRAIHVPRGNLESRIEALVPGKDEELIVYCAGGARSAFAAKTLRTLV